MGRVLRLSRVKSSNRRRPRGRGLNPDASVQRQLRLIREHAAGHGLKLPDELIYRDNGQSAWTPGNRHRSRLGPDAGRWQGREVRRPAGLEAGPVRPQRPRRGRPDRPRGLGRWAGLGPDRPAQLAREVGVPQADRGGPHSSNETWDKVRAAFADMVASGYRVGGSGRLFGFEILSRPAWTTTAATTRTTTTRTGKGSPARPPWCARTKPRSSATCPAAAGQRDGRSRWPTTSTPGASPDPGRDVECAEPVPHAGQPAVRRVAGLQGRDHHEAGGSGAVLDSETFERVQAKWAPAGGAAG